jgi:hypothetical protein
MASATVFGMTRSSSRKRFGTGWVGLALLLGLWVGVGCATTPKVDWDARLGLYTYDQAVLELGPPDRATQLSDGTTVAEWFGRPGAGVSFGVGTGFYGGRTGVGVGQTVSPGRSVPVLRLTFDPEGYLASWTRVRR